MIEAGRNYGWRAWEGFECHNTSECYEGQLRYDGAVLPVTEPVLVYGHRIGRAVVGGHVYRGCRYPQLQGTYFYGDYMTGIMWKAREVNGTWSSERIYFGDAEVCRRPRRKLEV